MNSSARILRICRAFSTIFGTSIHQTRVAGLLRGFKLTRLTTPEHSLAAPQFAPSAPVPLCSPHLKTPTTLARTLHLGLAGAVSLGAMLPAIFSSLAARAMTFPLLPRPLGYQCSAFSMTSGNLHPTSTTTTPRNPLRSTLHRAHIWEPGTRFRTTPLSTAAEPMELSATPAVTLVAVGALVSLPMLPAMFGCLAVRAMTPPATSDCSTTSGSTTSPHNSGHGWAQPTPT